MRALVGAASFICLIGGSVSIVLMLYYLFAMHAGVRAERMYLLPFLGPFQLFIPQLWDESGNRARIRLIAFTLLSAAFYGAGMLLLKLPIEN